MILEMAYEEPMEDYLGGRRIQSGLSIWKAATRVI